MQASQTIDLSRGGLGLGLALVKGLAELHGGSASAASEGLGQGATFTVRLPRDRRSDGGRDEVLRLETGNEAAAPNFLAVEDNADAASSLKEVLELNGYPVDVALSGPEGILQAHEGVRPILCDLGLPGVDGYDVARAVRSDPVLRDTLLVALSGYALQEDVERSRERGSTGTWRNRPTWPALLKGAGGSSGLGQAGRGGAAGYRAFRCFRLAYRDALAAGDFPSRATIL